MNKRLQALNLVMELHENQVETMKLVSLKDIDKASDFIRLSAQFSLKLDQLIHLVPDDL